MAGIKERFKNTSKLILLGWIAVLFLGLLVRISGLDLNPVGISHDDELNEMLNAKSLSLTGIHRPGFVAGILTQDDECKFFGDCVYGELGTYFQVPWMMIFPLDLAASRLFFVLISLGLIFATGKLFENLSKNSTVGMLAGLFVALNPWAIYYGRTAHTILISHLFYVLAAYFFTRSKSYKSNLILGFIASLIASLVYFGAKSILPFVIIWGVAYNWYQFKNRHFKFTIIFTLIAILLIGGYFLLLSNSFAGKRLSDVGNSTPTSPDVIVELGGSKHWAIGRQIDKITPRLSSFLGFFDIDSLFLSGQQATDNYYLDGHGYLYLIDLAFLILGLMALSKKFKEGLFILLLIAVALSPAAIKISATSVYSHRVSLVYPLLCGLMAWGLYYFLSQVPKKFHLKKLLLVIITTIYSASVAYFLFVYWYRSPVDQSTRWFFHERALASYIARIQKESNKKIILVSARPDGIFNSYVFYSGNYDNKERIEAINKAYLNRNYVYDNAYFIDDCSKITKEDLTQSIIIVDQINNLNCEINTDKTNRISNPKDAGAIYRIVNDLLCTNYKVGRYPEPRSIYDFKVEVQSNEVFCKTWISNPDIN